MSKTIHTPKLTSLDTKRFSVWKFNKDTYVVVPFNIELATALQRVFPRYDKGTTFETGDEPIFKVSVEKKQALANILGINVIELMDLVY